MRLPAAQNTDVPCDDCGAPLYVSCRHLVHGRPIGSFHPARRHARRDATNHLTARWNAGLPVFRHERVWRWLQYNMPEQIRELDHYQRRLLSHTLSGQGAIVPDEQVQNLVAVLIEEQVVRPHR